MPPQDSAALRRQLRNALREARTAKRMTQREIAVKLDWSPSKVIRIESGQVAISKVDLLALLREYDITDQDRADELVEIARSSRRSPWDEYKDVLSEAGREYLGYEAGAQIVRQFEPMLVPGVLQTDDYTRAVLSRLPQETLERILDARTARKELLDREDRPELFFIIDEAVVRRIIGSPEVMAGQLTHLMDLAARDNITIQVAPFTLGAYDGLFGPFVHLEFSDEDSVLFLESRTEQIFKEDTAEVRGYLDIFQRLEEATTTEADFLIMVDGVRKNLV